MRSVNFPFLPAYLKIFWGGVLCLQYSKNRFNSVCYQTWSVVFIGSWLERKCLHRELSLCPFSADSSSTWQQVFLEWPALCWDVQMHAFSWLLFPSVDQKGRALVNFRGLWLWLSSTGYHRDSTGRCVFISSVPSPRLGWEGFTLCCFPFSSVNLFLLFVRKLRHCLYLVASGYVYFVFYCWRENIATLP